MATITVQEFATSIESTPREVRKFLRAVTPADEQPGKGGRWGIEKRQVRSLTKKFADWQAERASTPDVPEDALDDAEVIEGTSE